VLFSALIAVQSNYIENSCKFMVGGKFNKAALNKNQITPFIEYHLTFKLGFQPVWFPYISLGEKYAGRI
jgi:hypothetical protein